MEGAAVESSQGPATGEEEELQLSTAAAHFPQQLIRLQFLGKRGERSCTPLCGCSLVCALLTIHGTQLHFQCFLGCQSLMLLPYTRALFRAGTASALPWTWPELHENLKKLIFFWQGKFGNCQGTLVPFSLTHISGLQTSGNHAQDFNNTNAIESKKREAGKEEKEKKNPELNVYEYSYEITSFFFFFKFFPPKKRVEKDNFLIETTYARTILEKKSTSIQNNY